MTIFLLAVVAGALLVAFYKYENERIVSLSSAITAFATIALAVVTVWAVSIQTRTADRVAQVQMLESIAARYEAGPLALARSTVSRMQLAKQGIHSVNADRSPKVIAPASWTCCVSRKGDMHLNAVSRELVENLVQGT